jgi:hypothetical protein
VNNNTDPWADLDIPEFLRISAEQRAQAWKEWRGFPSSSAPAPTSESKVQAEIEQRRRAKTRARIDKMLAIKRERNNFNSIPKSKRRWNPTNCRFEMESV